MPLSPQPQRRRALHAAGNHALDKGDQRLTKVDTVNPRHIPNNPEQIRTNPNTAKRLDQIGTPLESPLNTRRKRNLNTAIAHALHPAALLDGRGCAAV